MTPRLMARQARRAPKPFEPRHTKRMRLEAAPPIPPPWPPWVRVPLIVALAALGSVLYGVHVIDTGRPYLAWFSTVPWALLAVHPRLRGRGTLLAYLLMLHAMCLIGLYWLRGQGTPTWIIAPVMYYPLVVLSYFLPRWVRRRWPFFPLAVLWAVTFTGVEWFRVRYSPGELALCLLGYSQIVLTKLVQVADLGGVAAVTFLLAACSGLIADAIISLSTLPDARSRLRFLAPQAAFVAALLAFVLGYGFIRDSEATFTAGPTVQVLQPATGRMVAGPAEAHHIQDLQVVYTLSTARPADTDAILWPENSITLPFGTKGKGWIEPYIADLQKLSARLKLPILVDGWMHDDATGRDTHTAAFVMPDGTVQTYDKVRLLPWTEYVPLQGVAGAFGQGALEGWLHFVKLFVHLVPLGQQGRIEDLHPFEMTARDGRHYKFGTPVCFEIATPRVVNRWHRQGVDFLVNQTSEGRLGPSVHETTIAISGFRAIEGRVSVVRATNDGISALIDPNGRVKDMLAGRYTGASSGEPGTFYPQVILDSRRGTFYALHGDVFAIACFLASLALAAAALVAGALRRRGIEQGPVEVPSPG